MEMNEKQSRQLDEILRYLDTGKTPDLKTINSELFPDDTYDSCLSLFYILKEYYPRLLYPEETDESIFWSTEYAKAFLHEGGFTRRFNKEYEKAKKQDEKDNLDLEKLKYELKNAKRIFKTYWWTFAFALIALAVSLFNFVKGFLK